MAETETSTTQMALRSIIGRPALVLGPDLGGSADVERALALRFSNLLPQEQRGVSPEILNVIDTVLGAAAASESEVRKIVTDEMRSLQRHDSLIAKLCQHNWSAVVSLCFDAQFSTAWKEYLGKQPISRRPTVIAAPLKAVPRKSSPLVALLGHVEFETEDERIVIGASEYLEKKRLWAQMFNTLPDNLRASPLLLLGFGSVPERAVDFLDEYFRLAPKYPTKILVQQGDALLNHPTFRRLVERHSKLIEAPAELDEFIVDLKNDLPSIYREPLFARFGTGRKYADELDQLTDIFGMVPRKAECRTESGERNRLLDYLFRPASSNWEPFAADMAFHRDIEQSILGAVANCVAQSDGADHVVNVWGEAGVGKTTVLKNVAYTAAQSFDLVLWVKALAQGADDLRMKQAFQSAVKLANDEAKNLVVFFDDPISSPISIDEAREILERCTKPWCLVVCTRVSEILHRASDGDEDLRRSDNEREIEVPHTFTPAEAKALPIYLVQQGFAQTAEIGARMLPPPTEGGARDVLASLWLVLPQTQPALRGSVETELRRLGDPSSVVKGLASSIPSRIKTAQRAYQMVAVCSWFHDMAVPIEVLVSALGVGYGVWLDQCSGNRPLWGLLYDEAIGETESFGYRTRNRRVAEILCEVMNQNHPGHGGELSVLKELIGACTSTAAPYKSFLKMLLVTRRKDLVKHFGPDDALELYDLALDAYPSEFGLIEHHRAAVLRKIEGRAHEAYKILQRLLRRSDPPNSDNDSPLNLHNSGAATVTQMIIEHSIEPSEGVQAVEKHVQSALRINQFSTHSYHIQAKALLTLSNEIRHLELSASHKARLTACRIAEKGMWIAQLNRRRAGDDTYAMLFAIRADAFQSFTDIPQSKEQARLFFSQTRDQTLFVMVIRRLTSLAVGSGKGSDFKKAGDFLHEACKLVQNAGENIGDELRWCRLDLWDSWQAKQGKGPVDWQTVLEDIDTLMSKPQNRDDIRLNFWWAVALWNTDRIDEAEPRFQWLRQMMWHSQHRTVAYFTGMKSSPIELQGTVRLSDHKRFIKCSNFNVDLHSRGFESNDQGDTVHFIVGFTLAGPVALPVESMKAN